MGRRNEKRRQNRSGESGKTTPLHIPKLNKNTEKTAQKLTLKLIWIGGIIGVEVFLLWGKTKIRVVFLSLPKGTRWPSEENPKSPEYSGKYSSESKAKYYAGKLSMFEGDDLEFVGKNLVRTEADLKDINEKVKDEDGVLAFILTIYPPALRKVINWGKPTVLVNTVFEIPYIYNFGPARGKKNVIPVSSSDFGDVGRKLRVLKAIRKLRDTKILVHGHELPGKFVKQAKEKLGVEFVKLETQRLVKAYKNADEGAAEKLAEKWINNAEEVVEPTRRDVVEACKLYLAVRKIIEEERARGIAESIFCLRSDDMPLPCLTIAQLNDDGLIGTCQADLAACLTQLMIGYIAEKPGFVANVHVDTARNLLGLAHCVSPTKMDGVNSEPEPYVLRNHMGLYRSVAVDVRMRVGQKVTVASFVPFEKMLIYTGVIVGNVNQPHHDCRTYVAIKVKDAKRILKNYLREDLPGLGHKVLFYGDWVEEVQDLGQLLGFDVINEME